MPSSAGPGIGSALPALPALLYLALVSVPLALVDLRRRRLPNALVLPAYPATAASLVWAGVAAGAAPWAAIGALAAAAAGMLALWALGAMGMGDVKLAGLLGIALGWIGWGALVAGAFAGFVVGAVAGVATAVVRGGGRRTAIPYAPSMLVGATIGAVWGPSIAGWYLGLLGLA